MASEQVIKSAGLIVFRVVSDTIEYLLLQTSTSEHWAPPKGRLNPGEDEWAAAVRETEEEAGLTVADLKINQVFKHILHYETKNGQKMVDYWLAELSNPEVEVKLSCEHIAYEWSSLERARQLIELPQRLNMIEEAEEFVKKMLLEIP